VVNTFGENLDVTIVKAALRPTLDIDLLKPSGYCMYQ
jgi:hypothetical protein